MAKTDWNLNAGLKKYSPPEGTAMKKQLISYPLHAKSQHQDLSLVVICLHNAALPPQKKPTKTNQINKTKSKLKNPNKAMS